MPASVTMKDETPTRVTHQPCQAPISDAAGDRDRDGDQRIDVVLDREQREDDADQRHRRADREVEIARDDQHHRADRGEADDRGLQRQQDEIALREEGAVGGEVEEQPDGGEHHEQHRVAQRRAAQAADEANSTAFAAVRSSQRRSGLDALLSHPPPSARRFRSVRSAPDELADASAVPHHDDPVADVDQFLGVGRGEQDRTPLRPGRTRFA